MNLAIKGHPERGNKVIERLEMLGGINTHNLYGDESYAYYTIDGDKEIKGGIYVFGDEQLRHFTLEEFEEKFPYKVGDKVNYVKYNDDYPSVYTIQRMWWTGVTIEYLLDSSGFSALTKDLQPYKEENYCQVIGIGNDTSSNGINTSASLINEETMEEKDKAMAPNLVGEDYSGKRFGYKIPQGYEFDCIQNNQIIIKPIKPQYPKTYKECCEVIGINRHDIEIDLPQTYQQKMFNLFKLHICRDTYWKIAGDEMGLGKPWKPDYITEDNQLAYIITTQRGYLSKNTARHWNYILAFPTAEIRNIFYENFKDLIENCKELL